MSERAFQYESNDELLSAYIDDELSVEERAAVEARLASDPEAQQLLHQLRSVSQSVQALPQMSAGPDLRNEILRRVESRKPMVAAAPEESAKGLASTISNDPIFQSRRPWIWATLALAAGLLIMVVPWNNRSADKLREVAQNASTTDTRRNLDEPRGASEAAPPASASSVAKTTLPDKSRLQTLGSSPAPLPAELALEGKSSADKLSSALPDLPAAATAVPDAKPAATATAGLDELKRADRFAAVNKPPPTSGAMAIGAPFAPEPQDGAAVPKNETVAAGEGTFGGPAFKGGPAPPSPSTIAAKSTQSPSLIAGGAAAPPRESQSESDDSNDSLVVVHVIATQNAIGNRSFDALLKSKGINVESDDMSEASGRAGGVASRAKNRPISESESLAERNSPISHQDNADIVLVEAPESTIKHFLSELKDDVTNYSSIAVDEPLSRRDRSEVNGGLKEATTDLGVFNRGLVTDKQKDASYFYGAGRGGAKVVAPSGGVISGQDMRLEQAKQVRQDAIEPSTLGRARRLSSFEVKQPRLEQAAERGRARGFAESDKPTLRRSVSGAEKSASSEGDNLQVLFVVTPEQAAAPSAPAAKPAE